MLECFITLGPGMPARDKHSSLFGPLVSCDENEVLLIRLQVGGRDEGFAASPPDEVDPERRVCLPQVGSRRSENIFADKIYRPGDYGESLINLFFLVIDDGTNQGILKGEESLYH
jgi:hypothetical protein